MYNIPMDDKTILAYDNYAEKYDEETIDFWERFPRTFFDKFISLSSGKILDIGSGPGRDGKILQSNGLEVICVDASQSMVELSAKRGLKSIVADFAELPFEDNHFDGVWAYTSLLHVPKKQMNQSIIELKRVLKPNGIFGLGMIEGDTEEYRVTSKVIEPRWFSFYNRNELETLLKENGFDILYFEQFKPNTKNYLNFIARNS